MIVVKDLWKSYSGTQVLERINLTIEDGEFVTIVGPSGCGKTTFLNILLGVEPATCGEIVIGGCRIAKEPGVDCGIVFQRYSVFPHMSVLGNVMAARSFQQSNITGKLFGMQRTQANLEAVFMLEQVGLSHVLKRFPHELSGGMLQRLALAQTLCAKPRLLLLDEPFGALDPGVRKDMQKLMRSLWQQHNLTVVMVTHSLSEGFYLGTRVVVFDKPCDKHREYNAVGATVTYDLPVNEPTT